MSESLQKIGASVVSRQIDSGNVQRVDEHDALQLSLAHSCCTNFIMSSKFVNSGCQLGKQSLS